MTTKKVVPIDDHIGRLVRRNSKAYLYRRSTDQLDPFGYLNFRQKDSCNELGEFITSVLADLAFNLLPVVSKMGETRELTEISAVCRFGAPTGMDEGEACSVILYLRYGDKDVNETLYRTEQGIMMFTKKGCHGLEESLRKTKLVDIRDKLDGALKRGY